MRIKATNFEHINKGFGTRKTKTINPNKIDRHPEEDKMEKVMHEYKTGELKTSSGKKVTNRKQAVAIGMSEQRREEQRETHYNTPHKNKSQEEIIEDYRNAKSSEDYRKVNEEQNEYRENNKNNKETLELTADKPYIEHMKKHLEKEHPKTKGKMRIEKSERQEYYKHETGFRQNERLPHKSNTGVSEDFILGHDSKSNSMVSRNGILYSYDTPIAMKTGEREITITNKKYSTTTSRQVSQLKSKAERDGYRVKREEI
jgi:hypothetical protein